MTVENDRQQAAGSEVPSEFAHGDAESKGSQRAAEADTPSAIDPAPVESLAEPKTATVSEELKAVDLAVRVETPVCARSLGNDRPIAPFPRSDHVRA